MTPFKELYPSTRQPRRLPKQSDAVLADLFSTSLLTDEESKPFPRSQRTNPYTGVGSVSPACTLLKGGQIHTVPAQFPQTVKVIMHRKRYLEPKRWYVVGAGGFSSPSTEKRSRNPVTECGTTRNTLFSAEDKTSIESSPLKGCAAQPCLPGKTSRQAAAKGACTPEVELPSPSGYTGHLWNYVCLHHGLSLQYVIILVKQGQTFMYPERSDCYNCVFAGSYPSPVEIHKREFPYSTLVQLILFLQALEIKQKISAGFSVGKCKFWTT